MSEVTTHSLILPRRMGRPKAENPLTPVTIWITPDHHDQLIKLASVYDLSVSALGRKVVERAIDRAIDNPSPSTTP